MPNRTWPDDCDDTCACDGIQGRDQECHFDASFLVTHILSLTALFRLQLLHLMCTLVHQKTSPIMWVLLHACETRLRRSTIIVCLCTLCSLAIVLTRSLSRSLHHFVSLCQIFTRHPHAFFTCETGSMVSSSPKNVATSCSLRTAPEPLKTELAMRAPQVGHPLEMKCV